MFRSILVIPLLVLGSAWGQSDDYNRGWNDGYASGQADTQESTKKREIVLQEKIVELQQTIKLLFEADPELDAKLKVLLALKEIEAEQKASMRRVQEEEARRARTVASISKDGKTIYLENGDALGVASVHAERAKQIFKQGVVLGTRRSASAEEIYDVLTGQAVNAGPLPEKLEPPAFTPEGENTLNAIRRAAQQGQPEAIAKLRWLLKHPETAKKLYGAEWDK
ncbi:MAG: hypothetical protein M5U26_03465 [Planctomycetota bacterium]|nr:hypothetical protein [Planctomycetota bacterium]